MGAKLAKGLVLFAYNREHELRDIKFIIDSDITVRETQRLLSNMTSINPDITEIYAADGAWERDLYRNQNIDLTQIFLSYDYISRQELRLR